MIDVLVEHANIYTPKDDLGRAKWGIAMRKILFIEDAAMAVKNGIIVDIGKTDKLKCKYSDAGEILNAENRAVLPGFVDPHTHAAFIGTRESEFSMRMKGKSYMEILQQGGGILNTVRSVRSASIDELICELKKRIELFYAWGTTTIEAKSGYGLTFDDEIKQLEAIKKVNQSGKAQIVPTFLGAHAVPQEYSDNKETYINMITNEMIPYIAKYKLAEFIDVFCEGNVYNTTQTKTILRKGMEYGLKAKIHADEIENIGCSELANDIDIVSCDHLLKITDKGINALKKRGTIATLLPGTAFSLKEKYAPARKIINEGIPVAIATDCNPGSSYTESMPLMITLSVLNMNMTVEEAITASTLNAAYAVGLGNRTGSLDIGKQADFVLLNEDSYLFIPYHYGVNPIFSTYKKGKKVY